jgi:hypothetical protein
LLNEIMTLNTASLRKVLRENNLTLPNWTVQEWETVVLRSNFKEED